MAGEHEKRVEQYASLLQATLTGLSGAPWEIAPDYDPETGEVSLMCKRGLYARLMHGNNVLSMSPAWVNETAALLFYLWIRDTNRELIKEPRKEFRPLNGMLSTVSPLDMLRGDADIDLQDMEQYLSENGDKQGARLTQELIYTINVARQTVWRQAIALAPTWNRAESRWTIA